MFGENDKPNTFFEIKNGELRQQVKRYNSSFRYLLEIAKRELQREDLNVDVEILALEIVKVVEDTLGYEFSFEVESNDEKE